MMDQHDRDATSRLRHDGDSSHGGSRSALSEFICPGCGRPLDIVLHSTMCFAEAQVYCPDCERDYQQKRGQWVGHGADGQYPRGN